MIARAFLCGAVGAAAFLATTIVTTSSAEAACASRTFTGRASGLLRSTTGIAARTDWRADVRRELGFSYGFWSRASNRVTLCNRRASGGWYCRARARPCT
jgi:hypothetical protein